MEEDWKEALRRLLVETRVLSLAVVVDGAPLAGLLPYALEPGFGGFLIHASGLARHTRGLGDGVRFGLVIHAPDAAQGDPLQVARVTLEGTVRVLEAGTAAHAAGRDLYVARFPHSAVTFGLGDFTLFELVPERGRFVTGFAGAHNIGPKTLAALGGRTPDA